MFRKVVVALLVVLSSTAVVTDTATAQDVPPDPSCTVLSIVDETVTVEIADMRPFSGGEISFFNGIYYYDDQGNLIPNPFGASDLPNGVHEFTLIPGDWTISFDEHTSNANGDLGFIIGWGCDIDAFVIDAPASDPAEELRSYLTQLRDSGELRAWQFNRLIRPLDRAERAIDNGRDGAARFYLGLLTWRANRWWYGLDADQIDQVENYVNEMANDIG